MGKLLPFREQREKGTKENRDREERRMKNLLIFTLSAGKGVKGRAVKMRKEKKQGTVGGKYPHPFYFPLKGWKRKNNLWKKEKKQDKKKCLNTRTVKTEKSYGGK